MCQVAGFLVITMFSIKSLCWHQLKQVREIKKQKIFCESKYFPSIVLPAWTHVLLCRWIFGGHISYPFPEMSSWPWSKQINRWLKIFWFFVLILHRFSLLTHISYELKSQCNIHVKCIYLIMFSIWFGFSLIFMITHWFSWLSILKCKIIGFNITLLLTMHITAYKNSMLSSKWVTSFMSSYIQAQSVTV